MSHAPTSLYHRETLAHLGLDPAGPDEAMMDLLDERERACGATFPAAVREWYALVEAGRVERELYFRGSLLPLQELGAPFPIGGEQGSLDPIDARRLMVMVGEDMDCLWAVDLDGSDDPPVVASDSEFEASSDAPPWMPHAASFSTFILGMCWVNAWIYRSGFHGLFLHQLPKDRSLSTADLTPLLGRFAEGPRTVNGPRGIMTTRLTGRGVAIEIDDLTDACAADSGAPHRACGFDAFARTGDAVRLRRWSIKAESDEALVRITKDLRQWGLLEWLSVYTAFRIPELEAILAPLCVRAPG